MQLVSIDPETAKVAADLRARYNLRTPDALQLATAIKAGCDAFLTNDATLKKVTELKILVLSELQLS
jgi:predicted nucleic acid-binding protein